MMMSLHTTRMLLIAGIWSMNLADLPAQLPAFIKPGLRVTWHGGDSTLQGTRLVRDPKGNIWYQGDWHSLTNMRGSGGVGFSQLNVVARSENDVLCDIRHLPRDLMDDNSYLAGTQDAVTGDGKRIGDYWIHPSELAAMEKKRDPGDRVTFGKRTFGEKTYDVVSMASTQGRFYYSRTYDLATGFLLFSGSMDVEPETLVQDKAKGSVETYAGRGQYSHLSFVSSRMCTIPWADSKLPDWIKKGRSMEYRGQGVQYVFNFERAAASGMSTRQVVTTQMGPGLPALNNTVARAFGPAMFDGLWIAPEGLAALKARQVLDFDNHTGREVLVGNVFEGKLPIVTRGRTDTLEQFYDLNSGKMVYARYTKTVRNLGQSVSDLSLVENR
jgi:hypothetical protein